MQNIVQLSPDQEFPILVGTSGGNVSSLVRPVPLLLIILQVQSDPSRSSETRDMIIQNGHILRIIDNFHRKSQKTHHSGCHPDDS